MIKINSNRLLEIMLTSDQTLCMVEITHCPTGIEKIVLKINGIETVLKKSNKNNQLHYIPAKTLKTSTKSIVNKKSNTKRCL